MSAEGQKQTRNQAVTTWDVYVLGGHFLYGCNNFATWP